MKTLTRDNLAEVILSKNLAGEWGQPITRLDAAITAERLITTLNSFDETAARNTATLLEAWGF